MGSSNYSETYSYNDGENANGSLSQMTTATGDSLHYSYDALHRLQKVTTKNANGTALFSTVYAFKANGTKTTPLVEFRNVRIGTAGTILEGKKYEYDALGNITAIYESTGSYRKLVAYTYDEQNQLLSETYYTYSGTSTTPATTDVYSYTYDTVGNILTESKNGTVTKDYTYSTGDWKDLLVSFNGYAITYEGQTSAASVPTSGNPISYANGKALYSFDWVNGRRLQTVHVDGADRHQVTYRYDADGIRLLKNVDGTLHDYITQNGKVVRETIGSGTSAKVLDFIYDESGKPFALKYTNGTATPEVYYYVLNLQGDVVALIDESGAYVAQYTYNAWGEILSSSGSMADINPLRYRGYYFDSETGFYYLQSRYYDPVTHRFINADSYQSTGQGILGTNMFAYCLNNSANWADPSGCKPGDLFNTPEEAAEDFGNCFNGQSINDNLEYGTYIYEVTVYETKEFRLFGRLLKSRTVTMTYYSYTNPIKGTDININIPYLDTIDGHATVAVAHTHGAYDLKGNNEVFSNDDYAYVCKYETIAFMITPNGKLMKLDYRSDGYEPIEISSKIVHDPAARYAAKNAVLAWLFGHHCKDCAY